MVTNLGGILQLQNALHCVDCDDNRLRAQLCPGYMDTELMDMTAHESKGKLQLLCGKRVKERVTVQVRWICENI